jgi:predicted transcriptional regulator
MGWMLMSENTLELAENKLLLLYILKKIRIPVSNNKITQIVLENNLINYFVLQQYIDELLTSKFIAYINPKVNHNIGITKSGIQVLKLFQSMISQEKIDTIDKYLKKQLKSIKENISINADYICQNKNTFIADLSATRDDTILINIKLAVESDKEAKKLCEKWRNSHSDIYYNIIQMLLEN